MKSIMNFRVGMITLGISAKGFERVGVDDFVRFKNDEVLKDLSQVILKTKRPITT